MLLFRIGSCFQAAQRLLLGQSPRWNSSWKVLRAPVCHKRLLLVDTGCSCNLFLLRACPLALETSLNPLTYLLMLLLRNALIILLMMRLILLLLGRREKPVTSSRSTGSRITFRSSLAFYSSFWLRVLSLIWRNILLRLSLSCWVLHYQIKNLRFLVITTYSGCLTSWCSHWLDLSLVKLLRISHREPVSTLSLLPYTWWFFSHSWRFFSNCLVWSASLSHVSSWGRLNY